MKMYFILTYPAVRFPRFSLITYPAVHILILFSLTLLCHFPAFRLSLTLPCPYSFYFHLPCCALFPAFRLPLTPYSVPCCALFFFTLTVLCLYFSTHSYCSLRLSRFTITTPCCHPYLSSHLPCCAIIFLRTNPAVP